MKSVQSFIPYFYNKPVAMIPPLSSDQGDFSYLMRQPRFGRFCDEAAFQSLQKHLIAVDITQECQDIRPEHYLEVCVPVLNLSDLCASDPHLNPYILHSSLVAVNGFCARSSVQHERVDVDFIRVLDLADNRYEVIVTPPGKLELPADGFGLYTIIKELTYILNYEQVINGAGFATLSDRSAAKNTLHFLPPPTVNEDFLCYVCLTRIDHRHRRIVESIRPVQITFTKQSDDQSDTVLTAIRQLQGLYTEHEYMRDMLQGEFLRFFSKNNYNNFLLRPETFSRLYHRAIHDFAYGYIDRTFLAEKVPSFSVLSLDHRPPC